MGPKPRTPGTADAALGGPRNRPPRRPLPWLALEEEGAAYLEYALLAAFVAVACVAAVAAFGLAVAALYSGFASRIP